MRTEIWSNQMHEKWKQTKHHVSTDSTLSERYGYRFSNPKSITLIYWNQYADIGSFAQLHENLTNNPLKFSQEKRVFWSPQHSELHVDRKFQREREKKSTKSKEKSKQQTGDKKKIAKTKAKKAKRTKWLIEQEARSRNVYENFIFKIRWESFARKKGKKSKKGNQEDESCCFYQHTYARN